MRVTFAGVGEAFDETLANTSILVESRDGSILLDCGFTAASAFWSCAAKPLKLDGVYVTHFHGDHWFGIPALLVRSAEEGREKPLTILGQPGIADAVRQLMELAYAGAMSKVPFEVRFEECAADSVMSHAGFRLRFADNGHTKPCRSIRLDHEGHSVFYSGDGRPTDQTRALAKGCDLVIHESFSLEPDAPGHGTVDSSIAFARTAGAKTLALVHVNRKVRRTMRETILARAATVADCRVMMPEPGESVSIGG